LYIVKYAKGYTKSEGVAHSTYYIYKNEPLFAGQQYNRFLASYNAANRTWIEQDQSSIINFEFDSECDLILQIAGTGGEVDVVYNISSK